MDAERPLGGHGDFRFPRTNSMTLSQCGGRKNEEGERWSVAAPPASPRVKCARKRLDDPERKENAPCSCPRSGTANRTISADGVHRQRRTSIPASMPRPRAAAPSTGPSATGRGSSRSVWTGCCGVAAGDGRSAPRRSSAPSHRRSCRSALSTRCRMRRHPRFASGRGDAIGTSRWTDRRCPRRG